MSTQFVAEMKAILRDLSKDIENIKLMPLGKLEKKEQGKYKPLGRQFAATSAHFNETKKAPMVAATAGGTRKRSRRNRRKSK